MLKKSFKMLNFTGLTIKVNKSKFRVTNNVKSIYIQTI